jgi:hypothetical protein
LNLARQFYEAICDRDVGIENPIPGKEWRLRDTVLENPIIAINFLALSRV